MDLHVERLTLRLPGLTAPEAHRLAALVTTCLAAADAPATGLALERLQVSVARHPGESLESMARRIAAEMLYALARAS